MTTDLSSFFETNGACPDCASRDMCCVEDGSHERVGRHIARAIRALAGSTKEGE